MKIDLLAKELMSAGRKKVKINRLSTICLATSVFLLSIALFFLVDYLTFFPAIVRVILTLSLALLTLFYIPWRKRDILKANEDLISLAREAETLAESGGCTGFNSTVISAVEFALNPKIAGLSDFKAITIT